MIKRLTAAFSFARNSSQPEREQQNALEAKIAARWVIPLMDGVRAAAGTSRADGDRLPAQRERDVRVSGSALNPGDDVELRIHGADGPEQLRIDRQVGSGAITDNAHFSGQQLLALAAREFGNHLVN